MSIKVFVIPGCKHTCTVNQSPLSTGSSSQLPHPSQPQSPAGCLTATSLFRHLSHTHNTTTPIQVTSQTGGGRNKTQNKNIGEGKGVGGDSGSFCKSFTGGGVITIANQKSSHSCTQPIGKYIYVCIYIPTPWQPLN